MLSCRRIIRPKMATTDSLTEEFECPVCNEVFKQPKVVGPCLHTLCRDCVQKYVTARGRPDAFPCPVCRKNCVIPNYGVDGLKDNFHLSSIIEQYYRRERSNLLVSDVRCDVCKENAKTLCKTCDSVNLCSACTERHNHDPKTRGHEIIGLCSEHDKPLSLYCKDCKCTICSVCKLSEHSLGDHDISPHRDVLDNALSEMSAATAELENAVTRVEVLEEEGDVLYKLVKQKSSVAEDRVTVCADRDIKQKEKERKEIDNERLALRKQIVMTMAKLDERYDQCTRDVDKLKKRKDNDLSEVRRPVEELKQCLRSLDTRKMAMRKKLRADMPEIKYNVETFHAMRQNLLDLASDSINDADTAALIERVKKTFNIGNIEPCLSTNSEGSGVLRGNPTGCLKALKSVAFPSKFLRPCHEVIRMRALLDGSLAIIGRSSHLFMRGDTECMPVRKWTTRTTVNLYIHNPETRKTRDTGFAVVGSVFDMAITSSHELILVVEVDVNPKVVVFTIWNIDTGFTREIIPLVQNYKPLQNIIVRVRSIETDETDNMFVITELHLLVVSSNGNVIDELELDATSLAYCKRTGILYIAAKDKILRYLWNGRVLKEFPTLIHGVDQRFRFTDIAIDSRGELLVTGKMERDTTGIMFGPEIRVYRTVQNEYKDIMLKEMKFVDGKRRSHWRHEWNPIICPHNDQLWLGCGRRVELCETIPCGSDSIIAASKKSLDQILEYLPFKDTFFRSEVMMVQSISVMILLFYCFAALFLEHKYNEFVSLVCLAIMMQKFFFVRTDGLVFMYDHQLSASPMTFLESHVHELEVRMGIAITLSVIIETAIIVAPCLLIWHVVVYIRSSIVRVMWESLTTWLRQ